MNAVAAEQDSFGIRPEPAPVQADLKFTLSGLMGEVLLRTGGPSMYLKQVLLGAEDVTDAPHEFKDKDRVTIVLTSRTSTLDGTVTDTKGEPITEPIAVLMFPEDKARWRTTSTAVHRATTDDKGRFRMRFLFPGRYYILAAERGRLFVPGPTNASFSRRSSRTRPRFTSGMTSSERSI